MNFISKIIIRIIKIYQLFISPYLGNNCRFLPTCSEYFIGSINNHGLIKGLFFGLKRLSSCHPIKVLGAKEGFDPVKKKGS
tara:strand:+ start:763 stop:1005 length:243 start_codon:yes stop_codon:yes gene_type:complete